jgi:hypothetical protein
MNFLKCLLLFELPCTYCLMPLSVAQIKQCRYNTYSPIVCLAGTLTELQTQTSWPSSANYLASCVPYLSHSFQSVEEFTVTKIFLHCEIIY